MDRTGGTEGGGGEEGEPLDSHALFGSCPPTLCTFFTSEYDALPEEFPLVPELTAFTLPLDTPGPPLSFLHRLMLCSAAVAKLGPQEKREALPHSTLRKRLETEKPVVFHAALPQTLAGTVREEIEDKDRIEVLCKLSTKRHQEILAFEAQLDDLGPREHIDPCGILEHHLRTQKATNQASGGNTKEDLQIVGIPGRTEVHPIQLQALDVLQEPILGICWSQTPETETSSPFCDITQATHGDGVPRSWLPDLHFGRGEDGDDEDILNRHHESGMLGGDLGFKVGLNFLPYGILQELGTSAGHALSPWGKYSLLRAPREPGIRSHGLLILQGIILTLLRSYDSFTPKPELTAPLKSFFLRIRKTGPHRLATLRRPREAVGVQLESVPNPRGSLGAEALSFLVKSTMGLCHQAVVDWFNLCCDVPADQEESRKWMRLFFEGNGKQTKDVCYLEIENQRQAMRAPRMQIWLQMLPTFLGEGEIMDSALKVLGSLNLPQSWTAEKKGSPMKSPKKTYINSPVGEYIRDRSHVVPLLRNVYMKNDHQQPIRSSPHNPTMCLTLIEQGRGSPT
ncbi:unnamed protein product [Darwinula stevensoni]|uniref:Uncharacterized protein n=1 Tax=Darwinula stevensoni TaxID=69355 RepID=A0A7R9FPS3_9CRUS|nr:unnamed protein product [Darwinula stevensoni]CAG0898037.1 unnamed protein product [Darwinula stevensoni]